MLIRSEIAALLDRHRQLDKLIDVERSRFVSDWNCINPLTDRLLSKELATLAMSRRDPDSYVYFDDDIELSDAISKFHRDQEELHLSQDNILAGPGPSSFIAAFSIWLRRKGVKQVHYLPPLYHTLHLLLASLDIDAIPIATEHAFDPKHSMALPSRQTILLLCDPIWFAGRCMTREQMMTIDAWQRRTRSLVFIDGSFQYMKWDRTRREHSATLDPELTFRLVSPGKALAVPTFRFAYLLHPADAHKDMVFLYESVVGGANATDREFAHRAMQVVSSDDTNHLMSDYFAGIYTDLLQRQIIQTRISPECGYFIFATLLKKPPGCILMDQSYFELSGYAGYSRINLMTARRMFLAH